jgi:nucleolar GTP-binding protein
MFHPETNQRYQMMDTPGVLSRPDDERNCMEALTLASMQHLPTAVVFVMDLSGMSGEQSSVDKQIAVRNELRKRFPVRPWLDIISKVDLPREGLDEAVSACAAAAAACSAYLM